MARKLNELKLLQGIDGYVEVSNRLPTPQFVPCFVPFQPQPRIYPPKRRLEIAIEVKPDAEAPLPIKITHTASN
jgi:hypothetical protein